MCFTEDLLNSSNESEVEVFKKFVAKLMSLPQQLVSSYHDDKFSRDVPMTEADIPSIQIISRDLTTHIAKQLTYLIVNQLSKMPKTIGSAYINHETPHILQQTDDAMYTLGQNYGGAAYRTIM